MDLSLLHSSSIAFTSAIPPCSKLDLNLSLFSADYSAFPSLVNILRANIVFLTFFCYQVSEDLRIETSTLEISSTWLERASINSLFLCDDFTRELKISIAKSLWWLDLATFLSSVPPTLISESARFVTSLAPATVGKRYLRSGFMRLLPSLELHSSKILVKNC